MMRMRRRKMRRPPLDVSATCAAAAAAAGETPPCRGSSDEPSAASCSAEVGQQQGTHRHHAIGPPPLTSCTAVDWPSTSSPLPSAGHGLTASVKLSVRPLDLEPTSASQPEVCRDCFYSVW